jgi:hypothetical protein
MATSDVAMPTARTGSETSAGARMAPLLGIVYAVLFFVAFLLENTPDDDASDAKWTNYFASSGHRTQIIVAAFLFVVAAACMAAFMSTLWSRLGSAGRNPLGLVAAGTGAAAIAIGGTFTAVIPGAMAFGSLREPSADLLRVSSDMGYPVISVAGMIALAVAIAVLSVQARDAGLFGSRLTIFSLVLAVITLASVLFFPLLAMLIWFIVVSVVLMRRGPAVA